MSSPHQSERGGGPSPEWEEPKQFRTLRRMVTVLTATLIIGVLTIAATLVIRIAMEPGRGAVAAIEAESVSLPPGETVTAVGATPSALSLATKDAAGVERLRVFDPATGAPVGEVRVTRE